MHLEEDDERPLVFHYDRVRSTCLVS
jgi:hypothetical protein